jgi:hypothetical protein
MLLLCLPSYLRLIAFLLMLLKNMSVLNIVRCRTDRLLFLAVVLPYLGIRDFV